MAVYKTGALENCPAITKNKVGKGSVILYAQSGNDIYFYEALADFLKKEIGITPLVDVSDGVIVSSREKNGKEYIFAVNMKASPALVKLDNDYKDILNNKTVSGEFKIDAYGTLFITKK